MNDAKAAAELIASLAASYEKLFTCNRQASEYQHSELRDAISRLAKTIATPPPKE